MSATNGNGGYSRFDDPEPEWATRAELVTVDDKVDAIVKDVRTLSDQLSRANKKATLHSAAIAEVKSVLKEHSELLGKIGSAVINIESALKLTTDLASQADKKADRASYTNEVGEGFAKLALENDRDELEARRARRAAVFSTIGSIGRWAGIGLAPIVVLGVILKACGFDVELPPP